MTDHTGQAEKARRFLELHHPGRPLLLPNPWDRGSARLLAWLGFEALATTSSGFAATLGRLDGSVTRDEALGHAAEIVGATELPVSADLESGFADDPEGVAETLRLALAAGLAGCSVEDATGRPDARSTRPGWRPSGSAPRARPPTGGRSSWLLTARAENYCTAARTWPHHRPAPGLPGGRRRRAVRPRPAPLEDIGQVVAAVDRPVKVLALPGAPPVGELGAAGVGRGRSAALRLRRPRAVVGRRHRAPRRRQLRLLGPCRPRRHAARSDFGR